MVKIVENDFGIPFIHYEALIISILKYSIQISNHRPFSYNFQLLIDKNLLILLFLKPQTIIIPKHLFRVSFNLIIEVSIPNILVLNLIDHFNGLNYGWLLILKSIHSLSFSIDDSNDLFIDFQRSQKPNLYSFFDLIEKIDFLCFLLMLLFLQF